MRKFAAILLIAIMLFCLSATAFAAGGDQGETIYLTVTVPEPVSYTMSIPSDTALVYNNTSAQTIGTATVTDVANVPEGSVIRLTIVASNLGFLAEGEDQPDMAKAIPVNYGFKEDNKEEVFSGIFMDTVDYAADVYANNPKTAEDEYNAVAITATVADWTSTVNPDVPAVPGNYQAYISFNFNVFDAPLQSGNE